MSMSLILNICLFKMIKSITFFVMQIRVIFALPLWCPLPLVPWAAAPVATPRSTTANTTHSDLLHLLSDDLPIFDELSMFFDVHKCLFHSSRLVKFVSRYGVMFARQKSTMINSNFYTAH